MHVPDMLAMFTSWPRCGRNKWYTRLKARLDDVVVRLVPDALAALLDLTVDHLASSAFPDEKKRKRASKSDFALFTCMYERDALMPQSAP